MKTEPMLEVCDKVFPAKSNQWEDAILYVDAAYTKESVRDVLQHIDALLVNPLGDEYALGDVKKYIEQVMKQ